MYAAPFRRGRGCKLTLSVPRPGFRTHNLLFGAYSRVFFSRKSGGSADHGVIDFPAWDTHAEFLTIADTSPANLLEPFLCKVWKLRSPEIIISVRARGSNRTAVKEHAY